MARQLTGMDRNRKTLEKLFVAHIGDLSRHSRKLDVFRDFLHMAALSLQNATLRSPKLEEEYAKLIAKYGEKQAVEKEFSYLMAITVEALELECADFLGHIYMSNEMGIAEAGQFFTPSCVAKMMAMLTLGEIKAELEGKPYVTVNDPACGGGVMLIAAVDEFRRQGFNPSQQMCVYAEDIDLTCVHMAYVQLALLGVPALVSHRNSISMETWSRWRTPIWWLHGFEWREKRRFEALGQADDEKPAKGAEKPPETAKCPHVAVNKVEGQIVQPDLFAM